MAARQFIMNQVKKSPLVQAIQQKSFKPYKKALSNTLEPGNLMPMGQARRLKAIDPMDIKRATASFENDSAQFKAMQHADSAQATANRIKQYFAEKLRKEALRANQGPSAEKMLASYIFRKQ